jgi:C1A family cysteine protease
VDGSALFLHRMAAELMQWNPIGGVSLRTCCRALTQFGLPPHKYYPQERFQAAQDPPGFMFSYATEYRDLTFFRLDPPGVTPKQVLERLKQFLASGWGIAFGMSLFEERDENEEIPVPSEVSSCRGGQAVVAVGYDDHRGTRSGRGAVQIRTATRQQREDSDCGWLPYDYIRKSLAADFWTFIRPQWQAKCEFEAWLECSPDYDGC